MEVKSKPSSNGKPHTLTDNQVAAALDMIANVYSSRTDLLKKFFDPRRDINDECGYPADNASVTPQRLQDLYDSEAVAARVVEVMPKESWQVQPEVYEEEDGEEKTPFEQGWDALDKSLMGEKSWHREEHGSAVWEYLLRADILSGIGSYGVMLLGLDDLKQGDSLTKIAEPTIGRKLLFMRCFPEALAQITRFESDLASPRFGQPVEYLITFNDPKDSHGGIGQPRASANVHWSRVLHLADNLSSSEVFGVPRMRPVMRRLLDLEKIYASDGEGFWKSVIAQVYLETHPQLGGDVDVDDTALKDLMEKLQNGMQRWGFLRGMTAKTLPPQMLDPTPHVNAQIEAICIKGGYPVRVFKGSERGELASSQDDQAWNDRLRARQQYYITPRIIRPFVDRLIWLGVLPEPASGYAVSWPDLTSQTAQEKATVAATRTGALAQYVGGGVEALIPPHEYLTLVLGMEDEEAESILESAAVAVESEMIAPAPQEDEQVPAGEADALVEQADMATNEQAEFLDRLRQEVA